MDFFEKSRSQTVSSKGVVKGKKAGSAVITAAAEETKSGHAKLLFEITYR